MEKYLAEYLRLSMEDGDIVSDDEKQESDSISHQREIIKEYEEKAGLSEMETLEFVDDGYSGTNFNRPAVIKLLEMVREGKIYGIIVKDISRFGREYLEVGDYLEQVFPFMGVRFISINDCYDSNNYIGTTGGIEVAFKSILYSMYSKDLSVKMRSSLEIRRKHGNFIAPTAPYGYIVQREKQRKLVVDPVASKYVKRIFELACLGYSTGTVAKKLNEENIPTPAMYKNLTNSKRKYKISDNMGYWDARMVRDILENEVYLGTVVNKKTQVTAVGSKKYITVPEEKRISVPNMHEPIVTEEMFRDANKIIRKWNRENPKRERVKKKSVLSGKMYCSECGRKLIRITCTTIPYFKCKKPDYDNECSCSKKKFSEPELEDTVRKCIQMEVSKIGNWSSHFNSDRLYEDLNKQIGELEKEADTLKLHKQYLYEKLKTAYIDQKEYLGKTQVLRAKESKNKEDLELCQKSKSEILEKVKILTNTKDFQYLTKEIVDALISKIVIYDDNRMEIFWRFNFLG